MTLLQEKRVSRKKKICGCEKEEKEEVRLHDRDGKTVSRGIDQESQRMDWQMPHCMKIEMLERCWRKREKGDRKKKQE